MPDSHKWCPLNCSWEEETTTAETTTPEVTIPVTSCVEQCIFFARVEDEKLSQDEAPEQCNITCFCIGSHDECVGATTKAGFETPDFFCRESCTFSETTTQEII